MKQFVFISIFSFFLDLICFGQNLKLLDLTILSSKKNWEDVNQSLISKGWTYYDSEKGSSIKYNTITWTFNKDRYSDKSQGWFYLFTYEGLPNKISYSFFNDDTYLSIQNSISSAGFELVKSDIENNEVISTYQNSIYTLKISTSRQKDDGWSDVSLTAYNITLTNKAGIYDNENGKKTDYYPNGQIKAEYSLLNGEINGEIKFYKPNGKIDKVSTLINGIENGPFKEFDEEGNLVAEYSMSNGKIEGKFIVYEQGKISHSFNYENDLKNGQYIEYYYNKDNGNLRGRLIGDYKNDKKNGSWRLLVLGDDMENLLKFENFTDGVLNGAFQKPDRDSLKIGSYKDNKFHGEYKVYLDTKGSLYGGVFETDISKLTLVKEGYFNHGLKSGNWKYYDLAGTLVNEGKYVNGERSGEWIERYSYNLENEPIYYFQKGHYLRGKREGKWIQFKTESNLEEIFNYKNGELDGEYLTLNHFSNNQHKGIYSNGKLKELSIYDSLGITLYTKYEIYEEKLDSFRCRKTDFTKDGSISQVYSLKKDKEFDHFWFYFNYLLTMRNKDNNERNGFKDGEFKLINNFNQPVIIGNYYKKDRIGLWTFFYYDQNVKIESYFEKDLKIEEKYLKLNGELFSGDFTFINKEDGINEIRKIKAGLRNGKTIFIDVKSNQTIKKETYKEGKLLLEMK
ncbi:hypothetical protein SAMN00777080_5088 [Aquiflexum balticum DSM 16537]|uniref:Antitoxin component YwqK of the YwqJK toxin-antitoxin module n=1 Tax=Aquiflexum balticum DSM 16537 TaxID=758820 RepID=A0A1W2HBZ4_9BACT|nr:hypothetical protein [Aquiflexum balticum]SMD46399.1 hypothetical protein SAMN00777080_5088 [Aquiflexum balticum DSM 16537]